MRHSLNALTEELKRLKASGVRSVSVDGHTLQRLQSAVGQYAAGNSGREACRDVEEQGPATPPQSLGATETPASLRSAPVPMFSLPEGTKAERMDALRKIVIEDKQCRTNVRPGMRVVFGVGSVDATIFFVGEAPGAEEERQGEPFVGPAGQLLTKMISAMGISRSDVYIGNIMNWRPQMPLNADGEQYGNRPPNAEEMDYCLPFLRAQIEIVSPRVVVALGATAAHGLMGPDAFKNLGDVRGRWHEFATYPLMVTYHPSYILRNQSNRSKRMIWEDLLQVMQRCRLPISEKQQGYFL
jgi:uracil-DNA glycosylase